MNTWQRSGSITLRHGAAAREEGLPEALPLLLLFVLPRPVQTELGLLRGTKLKSRRIYDSYRRCVVFCFFCEDAGPELPGSRLFSGGAGRETLQEDEGVGEAGFKFSWRHRRRQKHLQR